MDYGNFLNFLSAQKTPMQTFMDSMKQGAEQRSKEAEAKYHEGMVANEQQKLAQEKEYEPLRLNLLRAQVDAAKRGGAGFAASGKNENFFQSLVGKDNPEFATDPAKVYEASNLIRQGIFQFPDGTPINFSPAAQSAWNAIERGTTYAGAAVPLIKANQAESEMTAMSDMINKDFQPMATTYMGYSPTQIADTFKDDDASQIRLGNFVASQAGQYELAQIRNRIAGGEPGITATNELMKHSGQTINALFPRLSAKAREQAQKRLNEYLKEGLKARKSAGVGASTVTNYGAKAPQSSYISPEIGAGAGQPQTAASPPAAPKEVWRKNDKGKWVNK